MRLEEIKNTNVLVRPKENNRLISEGVYQGEIVFAELIEKECQYNQDGKRVVLNIKVEVEDQSQDLVDLYYSANYAWGRRSKMVELLNCLELLPEPGEEIELENFIDLPVEVTVENVEKDDENFSNITEIRKVMIGKKKVAKKKTIAKSLPISNDDGKTEFEKAEELFSDF